MTRKKAASCCVALGAALALFGAAAGLSRPTGTTHSQERQIADAKTTGVVGTTATSFATKQFERLPAGATKPAQKQAQNAAASVTAEVAASSATGSAVKVLPPGVPARLANSRGYDSSGLPQLKVSYLPAGAFKDDSAGFVPQADPAIRPNGVDPRGPAICMGVATEATDECGQSFWYNKSGEATGFGSFQALNSPGDAPTGALDDGAVNPSVVQTATVSVCGVSVGYVTDSTDNVKLTLRIFQPGFGAINCGSPPSLLTPIATITWCAAGSTDGTLQGRVSTITSATGLPFNISTGSFASMLFVETTDVANDIAGHTIRSPGTRSGVSNIGDVDENDNGNDNCIFACDAPTSCNGPFGLGAYAAMYVSLHTTEFVFDTPDSRPLTASGDGGTTGIQIKACDIDDNGTVAAADRTFMISNWNANVGATADNALRRRMDVDKNNAINCGDWATLTMCFPIPVSTGITGNSGTPTNLNEPTAANPCNPHRYRTFTAGPATLPPNVGTEVMLGMTVPDGMKIPDSTPAGRTNPRFVQGAATPQNGIDDLNIDLRIENSLDTLSTVGLRGDPEDGDINPTWAIDNSDYLVTFIHSNITTTLVNRPYTTADPSRDNGMRVLLDDGDEPGAGSTRLVAFARSNHVVFGRYKPEGNLGNYEGRIWGGGTTGVNDTGGYRVRCRDLAGGGSGSLVSWTLHARLGPVVEGFVPGGIDRFHTLSCATVGSATGSHVRLGAVAGTHANSPLLSMDADSSCDTSGPNLSILPANFFDLGSLAFTGEVRMEGVAIDETASDADTEVRRIDTINLTSTGATGSDVVVTDWRLRSCTPIRVAYSDRDWVEEWNVSTALGCNNGIALGRVTLYAVDPNLDGNFNDAVTGNYWMRLSLVPRFNFGKACDPTVVRVAELADGNLLDITTGEEMSGEVNPACNTPGPTDCRIPYVNDPLNLGRALGNPNTSGIIGPPNGLLGAGPDYVPNVSPSGMTFVKANGRFSGWDPFTDMYNRNWAAQAVRAPMAFPTCPSPLPEDKPLPCDLICGTWGLVPYFPQISEACQPFVGVRPVASGLFAIASDAKPESNTMVVDGFDLNRGPGTLTIGRMEWTGAYGVAGAATDVIDIDPNTDDNFTIRFFGDLVGVMPERPDLGDLIFERNIGQGNRVPNGTNQPNNGAPEYNYSHSFSLPRPVLPTSTGRFWVSVQNNTDGLLPTPPDNGPSRWRWTGTGDGENDGKQYTVFVVLPDNLSFGNPNMAYCLFEVASSDSKEYCGDSVHDLDIGCPPAPASPSGLAYLLTGNPDNSGTLQINGVETKSPSPFLRNRWVNVTAPFKGPQGYQMAMPMGGPVPAKVGGNNNPAVVTLINNLIAAAGKNPVDYACEVDAVFDSVDSNGDGAEMVDHVFGGKLHFNSPELFGSLELICTQADGQEYGGPPVRVFATDVLHNNLDAFGIATVRDLPSTGAENPLLPDGSPADPVTSVGGYAMFVCEQVKDCNSNEIEDHLDIEAGTSPDCNADGIPDECQISGNDCNSNGLPDDCDPDCNLNGIADECDVAPICTSGCSTDCDGNLVPDECEGDCDDDGCIDACEILVSDGGTCSGSACGGAGGPCARDCNQDGVPDSCQEVGGEAPVLEASICFEPPDYMLGSLDPTGTAGDGQDSWNYVDSAALGFVGPDATMDPTQAALIVLDTVAPPPAQALSPTCLTNQVLAIRSDAPGATDENAEGNGLFSWGVRSKKMHSDLRNVTYAQIDVFLPTELTANDTWYINVIDDPLTASNSWIAGVAFTRLSPAAPVQILYAAPTATGIVYTFFNDPVPVNTCVTIGMKVDASLPLRQVEYDVNGVVFRRDGPSVAPPDGVALVPTNWLIATNVGDPRTAWFDCPRFSKGSAFDVLLEDCDNDMTPNGCEILIDLTEADCNCNGRPDVCDVLVTETGPGTCVAMAGTWAPRALPIDHPVTRPCSCDCDGDGIPDECETPESVPHDCGMAANVNDAADFDTLPAALALPDPPQDRIVWMFHNMEDDGADPDFTGPASINGQPTADPLASDDDADTLQDFIAWGIVAADFTPADAFLGITTSGDTTLCADAGSQSLKISVDDTGTGPTDGSQQMGLISGNFGREGNLTPVGHLLKHELSFDMRIVDGAQMIEIQPQGGVFDGAVFQGFIVTDVRFARAGIDYPDDVDTATFFEDGGNEVGDDRGMLAANEVQIFVGNSVNTGNEIWTPVRTGPSNTDPVMLWDEDECMRVIISSDLCADFDGGDTFLGFFGEEITLTLNGDGGSGSAPANQSATFGSFGSTTFRNLVLLSDNRADADPENNPGDVYIDNVLLVEYDDGSGSEADNDDNSVPDDCEAAGCATCPGDVNGDNRVNGDDIRAFVGCRIPPTEPGCACADMNTSGAVDNTDVSLFVTKLLTDAITMCP